MRSTKIYVNPFLFFLLSLSVAYTQDWAGQNYYKQANLELGQAKNGEHRVVFMGNSITEAWSTINPNFFSQNDFINRGISGQTSAQMLARFRADCLYLKPSVVIINAGTNDIAENTGPISLEMILANIISMAELAEANDIMCILTAVLPAESFSWRPELKPASKVLELNQLIKSYAYKHDLTYIDYYSSMVNKRGGLKQIYSRDGVHPNQAGYLEMEKFAGPAIMKAFHTIDNQEHSNP